MLSVLIYLYLICLQLYNLLHPSFVSDDPNERQFTFAQMKQIKHMYYESPDTWNYNNLAAHFGTDYQVILFLQLFFMFYNMTLK